MIDPGRLSMDKDNFLIYDKDAFKQMKDEEIRPLNEILQVIKRYELKAIDTHTDQINFSELDDTGKIIIILLIFNDYPPQILGTVNIKELLDTIKSNPTSFIYDIDDFIQYLKECHEVPEHLERYFSFSQYLKDAEMEGKIASFQVIDRQTQELKATFIIERHEVEELFYEIGL